MAHVFNPSTRQAGFPDSQGQPVRARLKSKTETLGRLRARSLLTADTVPARAGPPLALQPLSFRALTLTASVGRSPQCRPQTVHPPWAPVNTLSRAPPPAVPADLLDLLRPLHQLVPLGDCSSVATHPKAGVRSRSKKKPDAAASGVFAETSPTSGAP